jgi:abortive infection bacteriophage resistance protein
MVYRNGQVLAEPYTRDGYTNGGMDETVVPEGELFLLGDNRVVSIDSRDPSVGFVSEDLIVGKAVLRLFPFNQIGGLFLGGCFFLFDSFIGSFESVGGLGFQKIGILFERNIVSLTIEKIEIAVRSAIVNYGCEIFNDPYWITDDKYFMSANRFHKTLKIISKELTNSKEDFIIHFRTKYSETYPPAWILSEILPLGVMTSIYCNIRDLSVKKTIAKEFSLQVKPFESWMSIVTLTRNACCHHSRIWNKQNTMLATEPKHITRPWIKLPTDKLRIYFDICIIKWFLDCISPNNTLKNKICKLLADYPCIDISAMGFPTDWLKEELWKG